MLNQSTGCCCSLSRNFYRFIGWFWKSQAYIGWLWWTKVKSKCTGVLDRKNENLWESLRGSMVNGALGSSLKYSMYSLGRILKAPSARPKAKNPRVFGLWPGLGCGLGFAFRKSLGDLQSSP